MAKKKKRRDDVKPAKKDRGRVADEDEDEDEDGDEEDAGSGPRNDVYVGLSVLTLLAFVAAAVFLYLDTDANSKKLPPSHSLTANTLTGGRPAQ